MSFKDIIGQDIAIQAINNMMKQDQVRGAYLFLGPDGVGKRTTSIEFGKAINCELNKDDACGDCESCNKIDSYNHPDVFTVFPEGSSHHIKIEQIRKIIYQASLKPYEGKKRVFIITDAENMTREAQNAFLKLLEEPPQNHIFILTASNVSGLLSTVLSRCKVIKFYSLNQGDIQDFLQKEGANQEEAILFSHMAIGSLGKAMDFKEKDVIDCRDRIINDFFLRKSALLRENVLTGYITGDIEESLYMLLCWYRDLLISKFTQDKRELLNIDRSEEIFSYSGRFSREKLEKDILNIMKTMGYIRANLNPKIALFNMAVELKRG